jgi:selenocysteine-specific elongation factor
VVTIGGGRVLDPLPPRRAVWPETLASEGAAERLEALVMRRPGGVSETELPLLLGETAAESSRLAAENPGVESLGGRYVAAAVAAEARKAATRVLEEYHRKHPIEPGLSLETLRRSLQGPAEVIDGLLGRMLERRELRLEQGFVALAGFSPQLGEGAELLDRLLEILDAAGLTPPSIPELEQQLGHRGLLPLLKHAAQQRRLVAVESQRYYSPPALERFVQTIRQVASGQEITPSSLRDHTGLSRKYLIPLLEWADKSGVTRRVGDVRVLVQV